MLEAGMAVYGMAREVNLSIAEAERRVREELDKEGFGVLSRIDIAEKLREKLGVEFDDYIILGACNPPNAFKALQAEEQLGLLLPCNIIVYRADAKTILSAVRPSVAMGMIDNPVLAEVAAEIEQRLHRVVQGI